MLFVWLEKVEISGFPLRAQSVICAVRFCTGMSQAEIVKVFGIHPQSFVARHILNTRLVIATNTVFAEK